MCSRILILTTSALFLAFGTDGSFAQNEMKPAPDHQQMQSRPMGQEGAGMMGHGSMMGSDMMRNMMGRGITGEGMMGEGMMRPPFMMRMMFALIDADGDGSISLQEFQAAHERFFKAMDSNKDGKLTPEEIEAFIHGTK